MALHREDSQEYPQWPILNQLKTTPTPIKNGLYEIREGGGGSYAISLGPYAIFPVEIP